MRTRYTVIMTARHSNLVVNQNESAHLLLLFSNKETDLTAQRKYLPLNKQIFVNSKTIFVFFWMWSSINRRRLCVPSLSPRRPSPDKWRKNFPFVFFFSIIPMRLKAFSVYLDRDEDGLLERKSLETRNRNGARLISDSRCADNTNGSY